MSNILQFQQKLNYTASDFQVRVSVSEEEFTDFYRYTATFYIKTTATDLTPTTEINIGQLIVDSEDSSGKTQTFTANFNHNSGEQITVTCQGSLKTSGDGSITITSVTFPQIYDGHLTAESFIITPHSRYDRTDEGEDYYSYYARVAIKPDLDSFFMTKFVDTTESKADYGPVEYSISVTFNTNTKDTVDNWSENILSISLFYKCVWKFKSV